jgi:hypothetical protein
MKIQQIQFPLSIGTADTLSTQVKKDLDAEDYTIVYYAFIDTTQTSELNDGNEIPNKMLHASSLRLDGESYIEYKNDNSKLDSIIASMLGVVIIEE